MSDNPMFRTVEDFLKLCNTKGESMTNDEPTNDKELGISFSLPKKPTPDMTIIDRVVITKTVIAVGVILGTPISEERAAAIALLVSVIGAVLLYSDSRRRIARNMRAAAENEAMINAMVHLAPAEDE